MGGCGGGFIHQILDDLQTICEQLSIWLPVFLRVCKELPVVVTWHKNYSRNAQSESLGMVSMTYLSVGLNVNYLGKDRLVDRSVAAAGQSVTQG